MFVFKYFNFFVDILSYVAQALRISIVFPHSTLLLPVGISFYTFQALGYSIDVYRGDIEHEKNFINYALFVSFFPQLVAGPIERSKNLLPQFKQEHHFEINRSVEGLRLILFGLFKKIAVADMISGYVDAVYGNSGNYSGITLIVAIIFGAMQIYCDFSGYSDVARGSAKIFGFELMENFSAPYLSTSIHEFWSRWHISLSSWLRDYLYIPLGGNRKGFSRKLINLMIVFLISGLWHGASFSFVLWGALHGIALVIENIHNYFYVSNKDVASKLSAFWRNGIVCFKTLCCFLFSSFAFVFFRTEISSALQIFSNLFGQIGNLGIPNFIGESYLLISQMVPDGSVYRWGYAVVVAVALLVVFISDFRRKYCNMSPANIFAVRSTTLRWCIYYMMIIFVMYAFVMTTNEYGQANAFLYFQF